MILKFEQMEVNTEKISEQKESVTQTETDQKIEPDEQTKEVEPIAQNDKPTQKRRKGRPTLRTSRRWRLANWTKNNPRLRVSKVVSLEPPEPWTRRLRQNGRELMRNRFVAEFNYQRSVRLEELRLNGKPKRAKRLSRKEKREEAKLRYDERKKVQGQQIEFVNVALEIKKEDQKVFTDHVKCGNSIPELQDGYVERSVGTFKIEVDDLTTEIWLQKDSSTEAPVQTTRKIRNETKVDVVCSLIHSICRKLHSHHSHHHNRLRIFDNPSPSRSSNYILSTVVWHKLNNRIAEGINVSFS